MLKGVKTKTNRKVYHMDFIVRVYQEGYQSGYNEVPYKEVL